MKLLVIYKKEENRYILEDGREQEIGGITGPLEEEHGFKKYQFDVDTGELSVKDWTQQILDLELKKAELTQLSLALEFLKYNFDKLKYTILLADLLEKKIKDLFNNIFMDCFQSPGFMNIDRDSCSNVNFIDEKGLIQVDNIIDQALIVTKNISISPTRIRVGGEGMSVEYNYGMIIQASNDGGQHWQDVPFTESFVVSDLVEFQTSPTGFLKLRMIFIPKAIDPEKQVSGKAYLTSFAILY